METIRIDIEVEEVARPTDSLCRLLRSRDGILYLEYVVSTGHYKLDVTHYRQLSPEQAADWQAGKLDLPRLARELEEVEWARSATARE